VSGGELTLGFVPLNDAAPLVVAKERGYFAAEGLEVRLSREVSWATVRDKVAAGALDGAHMLAPITLACTLGVGGDPQPMIAPMALNRSGAAFTLSRRLTMRMTPGESRRVALARLIAERRLQGEPQLVFAVVFPYSTHNYLMRTSRSGSIPIATCASPSRRLRAWRASSPPENWTASAPESLGAPSPRTGASATW